MRLIAISADASDQNRSLKRQLELPFTLLSDPELKAIESYGVREGERRNSRPAVFLVRADGSIAWKHIGASIVDRPTGQAVMARVRELKKQKP